MPLNLARRKLLAALGGAVVAWPLAAQAQQPTMPVIGFLDPRSPGTTEYLVRAVHQGLKDTGYVDGENVTFTYRFADGQFDRLLELAAELVRLRVAVISASGIVAAFAAKAATTTIPIVSVREPNNTGSTSRKRHRTKLTPPWSLLLRGLAGGALWLYRLGLSLPQ